ncbi:MAG: hypothetical protein QW112_00345 [Candidatus Micrarchaeia archaeon]
MDLTLPEALLLRCCLVIVFFLLLAASTIHPASCEVDQGQSLGEARRLPEDYSSLSCNDIVIFREFGETGCAGVVDALCLPDTTYDTERIKLMLRDDAEREVFGYSLSNLETAAHQVRLANSSRNELFEKIINDATDTCHLLSSPTESLPLEITKFSLKLNNLFNNFKSLGCIIASSSYDRYYHNIIEKERLALEKVSQAMNSAMDSLQEITDELYCMGAGDSEYTGPERGTYSKIRDIIRDSKTGIISQDNQSLSKRWAVLSRDAWNMKDYFFTTNQTCTASNIINTALSPDGIFPQLLSLYREAAVARESMNDLYNSKREEVSMRLGKIKKDIESAKKEEYDKINPEEIAFFLENWKADSKFPDPARLIKNVSDIIEGIGENAEYLYNMGNSIYDGRGKFYISESLRYYAKAEAKLASAEKNLAFLESSLNILLSDAENKTAAMRYAAKSLLDNYRIDKSTEGVYNIALSNFNSAERRYTSLKTMPKGQQVHEYYTAYQEFRMTHDILKEVGLASIYRAALNSCSSLGHAIDSADSDDVNTVGPKAIYTATLSRINRSLESMNISELLHINNLCSEELESLYSVASAKYQYLLAKRQAAIEALSLLKLVGFVDPQVEDNLMKYEQYIYEGNFSRSALGNYKKMESAYNAVLSAMLRKKSDAFAEYFRTHTYVMEGILPSVVLVDQYNEVVIQIDIQNTLSLGNNDSFSYRITAPGAAIGPDDIITVSDPTIDVTGDSSGLNIFFRRVTPNKSYMIVLRKKERTISSSMQAWSRTFLDYTELRERRVFSLTSERNVPAALLNMTLPRQVTACEAYLDGRQQIVSVTDKNLLVSLSNIRRGSTSGYVDCYTSNPITVTNSNYMIENSSVLYFIYVRSNIGNLDNVWMSFEVSPPVEGEAKVYENSTGYLAREWSYTKYGNKYIIKWLIPALSGNVIAYKVVLQASSIAEYANSRKDAVSTKASAANINISTYLERAENEIKTLQYKEALNTLAAAERTIDEQVALNVKKDMLVRQAHLLADRLSSISNTSVLAEMGLSDISIEIEKKLNDFDNNMKQFEYEIANGNLDYATKLLRELESISDMTKIDNMLFEKKQDIFDELTKLENSFLSMSRVKDMSQYIHEIRLQKSKLQSFNDMITKRDFLSFAIVVSDITNSINKLNVSEKEEKERVKEISLSTMAGIKSIDSAWKGLRARIIKSIEIDTDNPNLRDTENIKRDIEKIDSEIGVLNQKYAALKAMDVSEVINNLDEISATREEIESMNSTLSYMDSLDRQYRKEAANSIRLGISSLEAALSEISDDQKDRASQLALYLNKAKKSYEEGKYLNSILYSEYVTKNADSLRRKTTYQVDPMIILVALIVVVTFVLAILMLRKEKPKETRVLEKAQTDLEDKVKA